MKSTILLSAFILLINCTMKPQNDKAFQELHKHKGTENYEIVVLYDNKFEIKKNILIDVQNKNIVVKAYKKQSLEERGLYPIKRISNLGESIDVIDNSYRILKDGTIWGGDFYMNWVINNDTTRNKIVRPLNREQEKDSEKWLKKFKELYAQAQYIYIYTGLGEYYFKINDKWFKIGYNKIANEKFNKRYPPKEDQDVRMVELKDLSPSFGVAPERRDVSLIKEVAYEQTFFKKENWGLIKSNYSAGWWYLEVYMPNGEVIKIKRYASFRRPDIKLYKIPKENGGRDDVLFIVQEPNNVHMEQVAGMYVIRPRNYKETPEYKQQQALEKQKQDTIKKQANQKALKKRRSFLPEE